MLIQCIRCGGMAFDDYYVCKKCRAMFCKTCGNNNGGKCRECGGQLELKVIS